LLYLRFNSEAVEKKNRQFEADREPMQCRPLPELTHSPLSPRLHHEESSVLYVREMALKKELMKDTADSQFSIYNPFHYFEAPGAMKTFHLKNRPDFGKVRGDFSYMHSARSEGFDWRPSFNIPQLTVSYDVFKGGRTFASQYGEARQPYRCEQCGKIFKTKYTLAIHLKMPSHTYARPFVCNICGKGFRLSSTLCRHKIIHTKEKPYKCHVCDKAFNRSSTLKTHVRTHNLEKEFVCDHCGKGFHQKGNLRNHILIHTGEKPYKCTLCQKAFNKLSNLKFHMHVHTDNSPYRCRICKVTFSRRCDLKSHVQNIHSQKEGELEHSMEKVQ